MNIRLIAITTIFSLTGCSTCAQESGSGKSEATNTKVRAQQTPGGQKYDPGDAIKEAADELSKPVFDRALAGDVTPHTLVIFSTSSTSAGTNDWSSCAKLKYPEIPGVKTIMIGESGRCCAETSHEFVTYIVLLAPDAQAENLVVEINGPNDQEKVFLYVNDSGIIELSNFQEIARKRGT